jgi:capsule polysaccharide export protein KpsC/LpsZ
VYEQFLNHSSDESVIQSVSKKLVQARNLSAYKKNILPDYPAGKYVLYLFHFQPEYTVDALANDYSNQAEFVVRVAKKLPADIPLVVKENPLSVGKLNRPPEYYESILKQPNIQMLDHRLDSHKLVKNAHAIITLTGTVGLEAMFFGNPVIVFGNIFYSSFRWAHKANSFEEGIKKLVKMLNSDDKIDFSGEAAKVEALNIMTCMYQASYEGKMINPFHPELHRDEDNISKLKKGFRNIIQLQ